MTYAPMYPPPVTEEQDLLDYMRDLRDCAREDRVPETALTLTLSHLEIIVAALEPVAAKEAVS